MSKSRLPKLYYFVVSGDYSYCVPSRDVKTVDCSQIALADTINFKFNRLSLTGQVKFISESEKEVMDEIKKDIKKEKKEDSFHDDKPRKSALKQRKLMDDLKSSASNKAVRDEGSESKSSKRKKKASEKKRLKDCKNKAALVTETELLRTENDVDKPQLDDGHGLDDQSIVSGDSSADLSGSSVEAKPKVNKPELLKDLKALQENESGSDDTSKSPAVEGKLEQVSWDPTPKCVEGDLFLVRVDEGVPTFECVEGGVSESPKPTSPNSSSGVKRQRSSSASSQESEHSKTSLKRQRRENSSCEDGSSPERSQKGSPSRSRSESASSESSSTSSSSSSTTSTSTSSSSSSDRKSRKRRKKGKKSKKSKKSKSKKSKRRKSKSRRINHVKSDSSESDEHAHRKKTKKSKSAKVKRNMTIYPGKMYNHSEASEDVVKLHANHNVFIPKKSLDSITKESKSMPLLIRNLVREVFTKEALQGSTAQGFPNRVIGRKKLRKTDVLPRLDPDGREAVLLAAKDIQELKKSWRPRMEMATMSQAFAQAVKRIGDGN
ncbi:Halomucin [Frankliniella fusca]|uniref:Halomucin n=1 Tax=Frankliniella fusca TaxID=407009 RepID=A0AAE1GVX1_9NEOP|nr:Halomucin [Frankliniella fusca]